MMILQDNFYGAVVVFYLRPESHCEFYTAPGWPPIFWPNCSFWVIGPPVGCQFTHSPSPLLLSWYSFCCPTKGRRLGWFTRSVLTRDHLFSCQSSPAWKVNVVDLDQPTHYR